MKLKGWGAALRAAKPPRPLASGRPSSRPHSLATALDPAVTKAGPGRQKRGAERRGMGRAGSVGAAAASSPSPSRGLSHWPPPWSASWGRGSGNPGSSGRTGRERVRVPGGAGKRGESRSSFRAAVGGEAPPPPGLRPAPPSLSSLSLDKAVAAPRPAPSSVSVPPPLLPLSLLLFPPPHPPSLRISLDPSLLLFLSPDAWLLRTPPPRAPRRVS